MDREEIRELYREKRRKLSIDECVNKSVNITNNLLRYWMFNNKLIHCFLRIHRLKEVDTLPLIKKLRERNKVCIPVSNFKANEMKHILLTDHTQFQDNPIGIPEPVNGEEVQSEKIDVVIVPLLAVDQHGNRLGYGKGFYDRFLAKCKPSTIFIGVTMFGIHDDFKEVDSYDIPLHYVVTPEGILKTIHGKRLENTKS